MATQQEAERWSKAADEKLRKMFLAQARKRCDQQVQDFVECSKREGLMVIFKCREQNKNMNECASQYSSDDAWQEYRKEKIAEYVRKGKVVIPKEFEKTVNNPY